MTLTPTEPTWVKAKAKPKAWYSTWGPISWYRPTAIRMTMPNGETLIEQKVSWLEWVRLAGVIGNRVFEIEAHRTGEVRGWLGPKIVARSRYGHVSSITCDLGSWQSWGFNLWEIWGRLREALAGEANPVIAKLAERDALLRRLQHEMWLPMSPALAATWQALRALDQELYGSMSLDHETLP